MPRRKYLDNAIPADNTAQIGKQQVNRAKSARYPKVVPTFSQGSKVPSEFIRTPEAAMAAHRQRSNYYFNQAPTLSNLLHGVVDYLKGNGYITPTLSAQQYGVAPGVGIGKSSLLRRLSKVSSSVRRTPSNQVISEVTGPYIAPKGVVNVTDPDVLREEAISYISTGDASPWFKSLYGPFNRQVYTSFPKEVIREYNDIILPRLINAKLANERYALKKSLKKNYNFINAVVESGRPDIKRHYSLSNYDNGYIIADKNLWSLYNAPHNGNAIAYRDVNNDAIAVSDNYSKDLDNLLGHELRHKIDEYFMRTPLMQRLLDAAYGKEFLSIPKNHSGYIDGYNMKPEQITINRDLRKAILNAAGKGGRTGDILEQNRIIQNTHPLTVLRELRNVSGYGSDYYDDILEFANSLSKEKGRVFLEWITNRMKNAMKYVPVGTGATTIGHGIYNSYDRNNK